MSEQNNNTPKLPTWQEFQQGLIAQALKDENFRKELLGDPESCFGKRNG